MTKPIQNKVYRGESNQLKMTNYSCSFQNCLIKLCFLDWSARRIVMTNAVRFCQLGTKKLAYSCSSALRTRRLNVGQANSLVVGLLDE